MTKQGTFQDKLKTLVRSSISKASNFRYRNPAKKLKLIGVTGTKGKTITTLMIYHILQEAGLSVGCISTISAKIGNEDLDTGFHVTSPEPWQLPKYLQMMVDAGIEYVVLETTSNGLQQGRLSGLQFEVAVITNIDSDHLDYHVTWDNYAESKFKLVEQLREGGLVVANADHHSSDWLRARADKMPKKVFAVWFSKHEITNFHQSFGKMDFDFEGAHFEMLGFGEHFLENTLAAIRACSMYLDIETIAKAMQSYSPPSGRMEVLKIEPYTVIVDFAHTPDSIQRSLEAIYNLKQIDSRIITVFGCAGDRDLNRRQMSIPAAKYSKLVVLTAEDPRTEDLTKINSEIFKHVESAGAVMLERVTDSEEYQQLNLTNIFGKIERVIANQDVPFVAFDEMNFNSRNDAIDFALRFAKPGDIVYITGKGHERSLCFGTTEFPWSDQDAVRNILERHAESK